MKKKHVVQVNTRDVPTDVRDRFKAYCARRQYTMQGAMVALLRLAVEKDLPLENAKRHEHR